MTPRSGVQVQRLQQAERSMSGDVGLLSDIQRGMMGVKRFTEIPQPNLEAQSGSTVLHLPHIARGHWHSIIVIMPPLASMTAPVTS